MGLVYHPERVGAGNIPADANGQSQYDAAALIGESLHELAAQQPDIGTALAAYMLYGSTHWPYRRAATRRSDVDLLVVIDDDEDSAAMEASIGGRITAVSQALHVDVGTTTYKKSSLDNGMRVNPFYAQHLASIHGAIINPVTQYFSPTFYMGGLAKPLFGEVPFVDAWPFAIEYLKARRGVLQAQLDQVEPDPTNLKGPFELPRNLGRTIVDLFQQYIFEHTESYNPDTDESTSPIDQTLPYWLQLLQVAEVTGTSGLIGRDIERLQELDTTYTGLLEDAVAGDITLKKYEDWLKSVYVEALERAFKVVDLADAVVHRTVELAQVDPMYDQVELDDDFLRGWYDDVETRHDLQEKIHRAGQIAVVEYDVERLLFKIAPKYPEIAARHTLGPAEARRRRSGIEASDNAWNLKIEWSRSRAKMQRYSSSGR